MKYIVFGIIFMFSSSLYAQEEVLFDRVIVHGGFGGPIIELSDLHNQSGVWAGGGGGVIVNDLFFGFFGQGSDFAEHIIDGKEYPLEFAYGGLWLGFVRPTHKVVHFTGGLKIGGGGISIKDNREDQADPLYKETVFVAQPEVGVELNLFKWFRIALTGGYRFVSGVQQQNLAGLNNRDFNSGTLALTLRFGKFYKSRDNDGVRD
ncbi:MAG: hypothetical protein KDC65_13935 [Saprospiraceae bacterium]|nr:hypothetical protein [Saprospiraceae bacterium]